MIDIPGPGATRRRRRETAVGWWCSREPGDGVARGCFFKDCIESATERYPGDVRRSGGECSQLCGCRPFLNLQIPASRAQERKTVFLKNAPPAVHLE
jgi:hypothetical protein